MGDGKLTQADLILSILGDLKDDIAAIAGIKSIREPESWAVISETMAKVIREVEFAAKRTQEMTGEDKNAAFTEVMYEILKPKLPGILKWGIFQPIIKGVLSQIATSMVTGLNKIAEGWKSK
jgi:hypothetical protein